MTTRQNPSRLTKALLETAKDMRRSGILTEAAHQKITMRHLAGSEEQALTPMNGEDIRRLREEAHLSQAVFARYLNVTTGYVSQLERGAKRPAGAALALLNVIRRKGIEVVQ